MFRIEPAAFHHRTRAGDLCAQEFCQLLDHREVFLLLDAAACDDENLGVLDALLLRLLRRTMHFDAVLKLLRRHRELLDLAGKFRAPLRSVHNLIAYRAHLRTMVRRMNLRHDVAAECRANLDEIRVFLHVENRAVRRESRLEAGGDARRKLTANRGRANEDRRRLHLVDERFKCRRVRLDLEILKLGVVATEHLVHTIVPEFIDASLDVAANEYCIHRMVDFCREFLRLADKLKCNGVNCAFLMLDVDGDALPIVLVDRGLNFILDELHDARRTFLHAQLTELAARIDVQFSIVVFQCIERADGDDFLHNLRAGNFILMDNEFPHVHFLQFLFDSLQGASFTPCGQFLRLGSNDQAMNFFFFSMPMILSVISSAVPVHETCSLSDVGGKMRLTCVGEPFKP